jgi:hypothetical protein
MSRGDDARIADIIEACHDIETLVARGKEAFLSDRFA